MRQWDINQPPAPLPPIQSTRPAEGVTLLLPLTHRGYGPGLIILVPDTARSLDIVDGVPSPAIKWAEEGYCVVEIQESAFATSRDLFTTAIETLNDCQECESGAVGLVAYDPRLWDMAAAGVSKTPSFAGAVIYGNSRNGQGLPSTALPVLRHLPGRRVSSDQGTNRGAEFYYTAATSHLFATPFTEEFDYWAESLSHTRNLSFLKPLMGGPHFDLEKIWDEHTFYEFTDRSVEHTMSTMVSQPYVNHVPTLTGGIGREPLTRFYRHNFIFNNSADTESELVSRTLGIDRVVDEFIFKFTHDKDLDWLLPGVPPTYKRAEIPFTAVVNIRGDRLYHEHVWWDQGTALVQLGLMPDYLPFPYALSNDRQCAPGHRLEYRVPIGGVETAEKLRDRNSVPSNEMFAFEIREVPK